MTVFRSLLTVCLIYQPITKKIRVCIETGTLMTEKPRSNSTGWAVVRRLAFGAFLIVACFGSTVSSRAENTAEKKADAPTTVQSAVAILSGKKAEAKGDEAKSPVVQVNVEVPSELKLRARPAPKAPQTLPNLNSIATP